MMRRTAPKMLGKMTGLVCPPFTAYTKSGDVDLSLVPRQVQMVQRMRCDAIFLGGTASEGASQTQDERLAIAKAWKAAIAAAGADIKLLLHVGATSLRESQQLAGEAERLGVDAIASVTPTFFKPGNVGQMVDWFAELAAAAPKTPFYYYHIPSMTGLAPTISVKRWLEEADKRIPSLHGVKYTAQNLAEYSDLLTVAGGKYDIMAGLSEQMLAALAMGAQSSVSAPYNVPFAVDDYHKVMELYRAGDHAGALKQQQHINKLTFILQHGGFGHAIPVLRAMVKLTEGVDLGPCRLPLKDVSPATEKDIEAALRAAKLI